MSLHPQVAAVLERWEAVFSLFRPQSELSRVNRSQARVLAESRGIDWVEVDYDELRGLEPDALRLF